MSYIILIAGIVYFIGINLITFFVYGWDKRKAIKNQWRVPEATLILLGFLGGAIGAMIGRKVWHHKTKKMKFIICVPISLVVTIALIILWLFYAYVSDGYQAGETARKSMEDAKKIALDGDYVFEVEHPKCGVVLYPGAKVDCKAYAPLAKLLSENGIMCAVVHVPGNVAFLDTNAAKDVINQYPEIKNWYVGGHSLGGVAACSYASKHLDEISGIILLASYGVQDFSDSDLPILSIYGSEDHVLSIEDYEKFQKKVSTSAVEQILEGGNHAQFGDYGDQTGDGIAQISASEQWKQTAEIVNEFVQ